MDQKYSNAFKRRYPSAGRAQRRSLSKRKPGINKRNIYQWRKAKKIQQGGACKGL